MVSEPRLTMPSGPSIRSATNQSFQARRSSNSNSTIHSSLNFLYISSITFAPIGGSVRSIDFVPPAE